jgi:beta-lactamase regulating signal transducer with metallopeptidase domain
MLHLAIGSSGIVAALGTISLKATLLLAFVFALARLLHRRSASLRHALWVVALGSTALLLPLQAVMPPLRVLPALGRATAMSQAASLPEIADRSSSSFAAPTEGTLANRGSIAATSIRSTVASGGASSTSRVTLIALIGILWLTGAAVVLLRVAASAYALRRLAHSARVDDTALAVVQQLAIARAVSRPIVVLASDEIELPVTWGVLRPVILLPADAAGWSQECRGHVLEHELAHIERRDAATQLVSHAAVVLFWFHPLVWLAAREARRERERACDDVVLSSGVMGADYAEDLLALALDHGDRPQPVAALAFARCSSIESRLLALLDPTVVRESTSRARVAQLVVAGAVIVTPLAAARTVEARTILQPLPHVQSLPVVSVATPTTTARSVPPANTAERPFPRRVAHDSISHDTVVVLAPAESSRLIAYDVFEACRERRLNHSSDRTDDGVGTVVWTASGGTNDCSFAIDSKGTLTFTPDLTAITAITPGGYFDATTDIGGVKTRLVIRASGAVLTYDFYQNDRSVPFGGSGAEWLAGVLVGLDRMTAFAIDSRFPALMQSRGAPAVLDDVERMHGEYAIGHYLERLSRSVQLDAVSLRRVGEILGTMRISHMASEVILAVAARNTLTDDVARDAFVRAAAALSVDNDRGRSLMALFQVATLTSDELVVVARSVAAMHVDFEKVRVLTAAAEYQRLDGDSRAAFSSAAATIRDDRQRSRALSLLPR